MPTMSSENLPTAAGALFHMNTASTPLTTSKDPIIIAVTPFGLDRADPSVNGWLISDYFAYNVLLHGLGSRQKWFTTTSERELLQKWGPYYHGNPLMPRKVVLSEELVDSGRLTPVTVVPPEDIKKQFLHEIQVACDESRAKDTTVPVILILVCHGIKEGPGFDLGGNPLSEQDIKDAIGLKVPITILTTACFSGFCAADPTLNVTVIAAARSDRESLSWNFSNSIRKRGCSGIFTTSVINTLTSVSFPENPITISKRPQSLQPSQPTEEQAISYMSFVRSIEDCCAQVTRFADNNLFQFGVEDYLWGQPWFEAIGIPTANFSERWNTLEEYSGVDVANPSRWTNQDPSLNLNPSYAAIAPVCSTANLEPPQIARAFLSICPGDWEQGVNSEFRGNLVGLGDGNLPAMNKEKIDATIDIVKYRLEMMHFADRVIAKMGFARPSSVECSLWHEGWWLQHQTVAGVGIYHDLNRRFFPSGYFFDPTTSQGPLFFRPMRYISAAIVGDADNSKVKASNLADKALEMTNDHLDDLVVKVSREKEVIQKSATWLRTLGKRARSEETPGDDIAVESCDKYR
ncbi:hypothetical protein F5Y04DRAFT_254686 [Hypomontagnella monticulosa]|nr:hypothetical protein F5Y04DRAFT_254686 [Hypomontagnella monticulosa]